MPGFTLQGGDEAGADPRDDIADQPLFHPVVRQPLQDGQKGPGNLKGPFSRTPAKKPQAMSAPRGAATGKPPATPSRQRAGATHVSRQGLPRPCLPARDGARTGSAGLPPAGSSLRAAASPPRALTGREAKSDPPRDPRCSGPFDPRRAGVRRRRHGASPGGARLSSPLPGGPAAPRSLRLTGRPPGAATHLQAACARSRSVGGSGGRRSFSSWKPASL